MNNLAIVCAYFNPCRYRKRRQNYDVFRRRVERAGVTLLTVELIFDPENESELGSGGDVLYVRGGDVMWQKERLLQLGIDRLLADGRPKIAWVDADIVFERSDWADQIQRTLESFDCVQLFDLLVSRYPGRRLIRPSTVKDPLSYAHGGGWAATAEFLRRVKLYQHGIVGGGDSIMANAFLQFANPSIDHYQWSDNDIVLQRFNIAMRNHISAWAQSCWGKYRIGYVPNQTAHLLEHGDRKHRYYLKRWRLLTDYCPETDVAVGPSGAFRWSSAKPQLHHKVREYFSVRREDRPGPISS